MAKKTFYVVWNGVKTGVYSSWAECKAQVEGYDGAIYKSFPSKLEADKAYNESPWLYVGIHSLSAQHPAPQIGAAFLTCFIDFIVTYL